MSKQSKQTRQERKREIGDRNVKRNMQKQEELQTISGLRKLLTKMQIAGVTFIVVGLTMPRFAPFYAEKEWHTIFGFTLGLPQALTAAGCLMLIASIFCFLRSYRCAKCGGLLGLTHYKQPQTCRSCGAKVTNKDLKIEKG